jgi:hypothetical protein
MSPYGPLDADPFSTLDFAMERDAMRFCRSAVSLLRRIILTHALIAPL